MHSVFKMLSTHSMSIILTIAFFALSVIIHELGHFVAAKLFRLYVPRFSIGFGKKLFSITLFGTEFCVSLLPFGGYVAIPQLGDVKELDSNIKIPEGLKAASPTAKIVVAAMGPLFNISLAFALALFLWINGMNVPEGMDSGDIGFVDKQIKLSNGTRIDNPMFQAGLRPGDKVLSVDGIEVKEFRDIHKLVASGTKTDETGSNISELSVLRDDEILNIVLKTSIAINDASRNKKHARIATGIEPKKTLIVEDIVKDSASDGAAIKEGDVFLSANGQPLYADKTLGAIVTKNNNDVYVTVKRENTTFIYNLTPQSFAFLKPYIAVNVEELTKPMCLIPVYNRKQTRREILNINDHISTLKRSQFELFSEDTNGLQKLEIQNCTKFISLNNVYVNSLNDIIAILKRLKDGQEVSFVVNGNNKNAFYKLHFKSFTINKPSERLILGLVFKDTIVKIYKHPYEQISYIVKMTAKTIQSLLTPKSDISINDLTGPAGLVKMLFDIVSVDFTVFIWFIILININLAMFNLIPLPILDGGHIVAGIAEYFVNRESVNIVLNKLQTIFFLLLFGLIIYVTFLDVRRMVINHKAKQRITLYDKIQINPEMLNFAE